MKILIFGGSGQLGYEIIKRANDLNFEVISPVTSELNISEEKQVRYLAKQVRPDIIYNCAAYTAVDKAEEDSERCFLINRDGARHAALAAKDADARLVHISTDYVFSGEGKKPLVEEDKPSPVNVYGKSKLEGENEILNILPEKSLILRTSSLYGSKGVNFVKSMMQMFAEKEEVKVVDDQFMSPTWAGWLAEAILDLSRTNANGLMHACSKGETNWYDFAELIYQEGAKHFNFKKNLKLVPIKAADFARPAKRPSYSVMNCDKLKQALGREPVTWQDALKLYISEVSGA